MKTIMALVAFALCFTSFAQAGERSVVFKTPEQLQMEELAAKYGSRFSYTDAGSIFGTVKDGGYEKCKAAVEGGYARGYTPKDDSHKEANPINGKTIFPMKGDMWACVEMDVPGTKHMVVALPPGTKYRVLKRNAKNDKLLDENGVMDKDPSMLDACGNWIFNVDFIAVQVQPGRNVPGKPGAFGPGAGGYVPPTTPDNPPPAKGGFCSRHKVTCWVIGTVIVGGIIYALTNRDDDNNAGGPSVSLGPDVSLDTSSNAPTIQAPDTVYNPGPGVSL